MEISDLHRLRREDFGAVIETLTECFFEDPLYRALIPERAQRMEILPEVFDCDANELAQYCDMSVVKYVSDRIGVMYLGNMMEEADTEELFSNTLHPYAKALLSAVPNPDPHHKRERINLKGELPSPMNPPSGCVFHTRCPYATEECSLQKPELKEVKPGHKVACLKAGNL